MIIVQSQQDNAFISGHADNDVEPVHIYCDNEECTMRALHPDDEALLQEFFYSHTPETIQQRYGYSLTAMTYARAHELVSVSEKSDLALGVVQTLDGQERLLAVSRYCLDETRDSAEVAFVVRESHRRHGLASLLLKRMMVVARSRGLGKLWALVSRSNQPMLKLFYKHGAKNQGNAELEEVHVVFNLTKR